MRPWWNLALVAAMALIAAACTSTATEPGVTGLVSSTTTITVPATFLTTTAATTRPVTPSSSSTTSTTLAPGIEVDWPFDGEIIIECELGGIGNVTPEAVVTVDGIEFWDDGPDPLRPGWWRWFANEAIVTIDEGENALVFVATFDDGSTISTTVTVTCHPTLRDVPGYITAMTNEDGLSYLVAFDAGTMDEQPDGWRIVDIAPVVFKVDGDALFVVYDRTGRSIYRTSDFAALLGEIDQGLCNECGQSDGDCPDRCFVSPEYEDTTPLYGYVPFGLLVDSDNTVQQAAQLDPTIAP